LTPLEAILTNEGRGQAKFFGWPEPFPDSAPLRHKHDEAEAITDRLAAVALTRVLGLDRFEVFDAGVSALRAAVP
jgi:hypothetical protein